MLAGPGLAHPGTAPVPTVRPAHTVVAQLPFKATLQASTHRPRATTRWRYTVRVTDLQGRPIRARARIRIVFNGLSGPPTRELGLYRFNGTLTRLYRWPLATQGERFSFRGIVTARGVTRRLAYWILVR